MSGFGWLYFSIPQPTYNLKYAYALWIVIKVYLVESMSYIFSFAHKIKSFLPKECPHFCYADLVKGHRTSCNFHVLLCIFLSSFFNSS